MVRYIVIPDTAVYGSVLFVYLRGFRVVGSNMKGNAKTSKHGTGKCRDPLFLYAYSPAKIKTMSYFIQNTGEQSLSKIINNLLPSKTKAMDFLVGYFYFSGMEEIYTQLEDKPMRILVGLDMDHDLLKKTSEFDFFSQSRHSSNKEIREDFFTSLRNLFNNTSYFENSKRAEAFKIYYEKIKNGTLEIRKTLDPCHAKMYIFAYKDELTEDGETPGTVITGSSNFSYSGLTGNNEINVRFHSKPEFEDAQAIFEQLWEEATPIVDQSRIEEFENGVLKHIWYEQTPTPYLLYLRILYEYFHLDNKEQVLTPHEITNGDFINLKYQEDAVRIGIETIRKHSGVIVADVVGLGKSIIGATIARNLDIRTLIIAPPHLVKQWEDYAFDFKVRAKVFSRGNMEHILEEYRTLRRQDEQWLIIVDEAHAYRNEFTKDYAILHEICQGNKVLLLTATPFNNRPEDIYAMVKLFQIPSKSTLQTVSNLGTEFAHWIAYYKKLKTQQRTNRISKSDLQQAIANTGDQIRKIIEPLVIRRSRIDLQNIPAYKEDLEIQHIKFPKVSTPEEKDYELGDLESLYRYTLIRICPKPKDMENADNYNNADLEYVPEEYESSNDQFQAARYKPITYYKSDYYTDIVKIIRDAGMDENLFLNSQRNLASFMRTLLVRRFESSQHAFKMSLQTMLDNCLRIQGWIERLNCVPVYKKGNIPDVAELYNSTEDGQTMLFSTEVEDMIDNLQQKGMFTIPCEYLRQDFFDDLQSDIDILTDLKNRWDEVAEDNDPKLDKFISILREQRKHDPNRKIVVFSQFADTVDYLGDKLEEADLPVFAYTSGRATPTNKRTIMRNFDAGLKPAEQEDEYQILVATDAISEGYNLHRAGTIFNYDIPYNPTRVIQRVGRINRINKKVFDRLYIYNYFPTSIGEKETHTREISTMKMAMIHAIMGEDTRYLTKEEELKSYFEKTYKALFEASEEESWDTPYRARLHQLINIEDMQRALELPLRSKIRRLTTFGDTGVLAFAKKNDDFVFKFATDTRNIVTLDPRKAFEIIEAKQAEPAYPLSAQFFDLFSEVKRDLFARDTKEESEKTKREALQKVQIMRRNRSLDDEYLQDLEKAIHCDGVSGYYLREINKLKPAEFATLTKIINAEYIRDILRRYDAISRGEEILIAAEEIQNITTHPQTELGL